MEERDQRRGLARPGGDMRPGIGLLENPMPPRHLPSKILTRTTVRYSNERSTARPRSARACNLGLEGVVSRRTGRKVG